MYLFWMTSHNKGNNFEKCASMDYLNNNQNFRKLLKDPWDKANWWIDAVDEVHKIMTCLHRRTDYVALSEYFREPLSAEHISEGRLSEEACGVMGVFDVGDRHHCIGNLVVDYRVHGDSHWVFCKYLHERDQTYFRKTDIYKLHTHIYYFVWRTYPYSHSTNLNNLLKIIKV